LVVVNCLGEIVLVEDGFYGRTHDVNMFYNSSVPEKLRNSNTLLLADKGFEGGENLITPFKSNTIRGDWEKTNLNMCINRRRIIVEHTFGHLKAAHVLKEYRQDPILLGKLLNAIACLHNWKLQKRGGGSLYRFFTLDASLDD